MSPLTLVWIRYGVLAVAGVLALLGFAAMAVQTRTINPFSRTARLIHRLADPLLHPLEHRLVRLGKTPQSAPWMLIAIGLVGGILAITFAEWAVGAFAEVRRAQHFGTWQVLYLAVSWAFTLLQFAIFVRVIGSWIGAGQYHKLMRPFYWATEWLIGPLRRVLPSTGMFDFSPLLALLILYLLKPFVLGFF